MSEMNDFLADKKGQLDINLAVKAIIGLVLTVAFFVVSVLALLYIVYDAGITDGAFYEALTNSILMGLPGIILLAILSFVAVVFCGIICLWQYWPSSE